MSATLRMAARMLLLLLCTFGNVQVAAADAGVARSGVASKPSARVAAADAGAASKPSPGVASRPNARDLGAGNASARESREASTAIDAAAPRAGESRVADAARELSAVLSQLAQTEALSAHFREEKRMSLLAQPLISEGTLHYEKPRQLARHTERPRKSSLLLQNDVLTFGDAQHSESIGLSAQPALRVLVETFVSVLAGDRAALERVAEVVLEPGSGSGFRIRVTPKDAGLKKLVRTMAFEGKGALLSRMELLDANGDSTLTTFSDVKLQKRFSAAERAQLFRIGG